MHGTLRNAAVCLGLVLLASTGWAEERKNPLEGQPAVRHRYEMRQGRFELGPSFGFSIDRALQHAITMGVKLEYHLNDWLSFGADVGYGINVGTGLASELESQCDNACFGPAVDPNDRTNTATWDDHSDRFSRIQLAGDVRGVFTPLSGKLGIFSKLFVGYDTYAFAGLALAKLTGQEGVNDGFKVGPAFGIGMHLYFTKWFSMGAEIKNLMFMDNESGGDLTRGLENDEKAGDTILINGDDAEFKSHWFAGINFTFFLPATPKISR